MSTTGERDERCETCRFWAPESSECHRRAPVAAPATPTGNGEAPRHGPTGAWPLTAADSWCGEWAAVEAPKAPAPTPDECVAIRVFLARVAPALDAHNPPALLESLLEQLPSDVRRVLVRTHGLDGRPPAGLKDVAREFKMSQGHVRALLATGEDHLAEVVRLLTRPRART
jgi:hypothetical protein